MFDSTRLDLIHDMKFLKTLTTEGDTESPNMIYFGVATGNGQK